MSLAVKVLLISGLHTKCDLWFFQGKRFYFITVLVIANILQVSCLLSWLRMTVFVINSRVCVCVCVFSFFFFSSFLS